MKKFLSGLIVILFIFPFVASASGSATMTLSPTQVTVEVGETFDLFINANPNGESLDTVRAVVSFTQTQLKAEEAVLTGAFDRVAPGNFVSNDSGIVSLGGFTLDGPVKTSTKFGRVTFQATQTGNATIALSSDSKMISNGEEKIDVSILGKTTVKIVEKKPTSDSTLMITSETHSGPEQWYQNNTATLDWTLSKGQASQYLYFIDQRSDTNPTSVLSASTTSFTTETLEEGIWYFHLKALLQDGTSTQTVHRKIQIDRTPPNPFQISFSANQILETDSLQIVFATTDEISGVAQYELSLNESPFQIVGSPLTMNELLNGTYIFKIKAVDKAGNEMYAQDVVRSYPAGTEIPYQPVASEQKEETQNNRIKLLITLAFIALAVSGIIYRSKMKKLKQK
ncbi:hypothetical protein HY771_00200 [Candidatus Uhrbacteria bacterium]|nr:hypothetical protein [Candidatus Uhrbacteria bacterium]